MTEKQETPETEEVTPRAKGARLKPGGPIVPWKEYCRVRGHFFRPDGTCCCGAKKPIQRGLRGRGRR